MRTATETLRRIGPGVDAIGHHIGLYSAALVLAAIGGLKFTAYEAEAIRPLVETSPLLSWAYTVFSLQGFSNLLGVVEITTAVLLALAPFAPRLGVLGAAMAAGTFAVTSTFLITGPSWEASLGGFPALSPFGGFVIKDLALLGTAVSALGRTLRGVADEAMRPRRIAPGDRPVAAE